MSSIKILVGDACNLDISSNSIDLIVTSPPYSGVDPLRYGGNPDKQINSNNKNMLKLLLKSTKEMSRVIKKSGSIFINIGHNNNMPYLYISEILKNTDLSLVTPPFIVNHSDEVNKKPSEVFDSSYSFWFHLSKSQKDLFYNPFIFKRYSEAIWNIPWTEKTEEFEKTRSSGFALDAFNSEIPKRFIEVFTKPNSTVLDPFGGSGVTAIQAYKAGRNGISIDISEDQTDLAKKRFKIYTGENYDR